MVLGGLHVGVRAKLVTLVMVLLIPVLGLQGMQVYTQFNRQLNEELHANQNEAVRGREALLEYLDSLWDEELALGMAVAMRGEPFDPDWVEAYFRTQLPDNPTIHVITWLSPDGVTLATTEPGRRGVRPPPRPYYTRIMAGEERTVSDLVVGAVSGIPTVGVARGIRVDGRLVGMVVMGIGIGSLGEVLPTVADQDHTFGVVDSAGSIVYEVPAPPNGPRQLPENCPTRPALQGKPVNIQGYVRSAMGSTSEWMGSAQPAGEIGWSIFSLSRTDIVLSSARADAWQSGVVLLLTGACSLLLALILGRSFLGPIEALRRTAHEIAAGDLTARVRVAGRDEIAETARTFNAMADRIEQADRVLNARVSAVADLGQQALSGVDTAELTARLAEAVAHNVGVPFPAVLARLPAAEAAALQAAYAEKEPVVTAQSMSVMVTPGDQHFLQAAANVLATAQAHKQMEHERAFLAEAGAMLNATLDFETTLTTVARLATDHLADWCSIFLQEPDGSVHRVIAAHRDPSRGPWFRNLPRNVSSVGRPGEDVLRVLQSGSSLLYPDIPEDYFEPVEANPVKWEEFRALGLVSLMVVPLSAGGKTMGAVGLMTDVSRRKYGEPDLSLAEELARRAALALDHARMYRETVEALRARDVALAEAQTERERLEAIFLHSPALMCIVGGPDHVFERVNPTFAMTLGNVPLLGLPAEEALPLLKESGLNHLLDRIYNTGEPYVGHEQVFRFDRNGDGLVEEGIFNFVYLPLRNAAGQIDAIFVFAIEVTEQVRARHALEEMAGALQVRARQQEAVNILMQRMIDGAQIPHLQVETVKLVAEALDVSAVLLLELTPDGKSLRMSAARGWGSSGAMDSLIPVDPGGHLAEALATPIPVVRTSACAEERLAANGVRAGATVRIRDDGRPYGLLGVYAREDRVFTAGDLGFIQTVAALVGTAIERRRHERCRSVEHEVTKILAKAAAVPGAIAETLETVGRGLDWDVGIFWAVTGDDCSVAATWSTPEFGRSDYLDGSRQMVLRPGEGIVGRLVRTGESLGLSDVTADAAFFRRHLAAGDGLHGAVWFPVVLGEAVHGIFEFLSRSPRREEAVLRTLTTVGSQIGQFIERKRAEQELRELNQELERRVQERTSQLAAANQELEAFAYSVSHDLRAPLRTVDGFSQALLEDYGELIPDDGCNYLRRIRNAAGRMATLIDDLLRLSRVMRSEMHREQVDLTAMVRAVAADLQRSAPDRAVKFIVADGLVADADERLMRVVLDNVLSNAWKFSSRRPEAVIEFGRRHGDGRDVFFLRDNGAGFDPALATKLFVPFQRLHPSAEFEGTGVGLATVHRIIQRHGGRVWAEGRSGEGATFYFTL